MRLSVVLNASVVAIAFCGQGSVVVAAAEAPVEGEKAKNVDNVALEASE